MQVLVDSSVWSHRLRRKPGKSDPLIEDQLTYLVNSSQVRIIGPIRQEVLSGIRDRTRFARVRDDLRDIPDERLETQDFELAAELANRCAAKGIQGTYVDVLICAVALSRDWTIFTEDADFDYYARIIPIRLYQRQRLH